MKYLDPIESETVQASFPVARRGTVFSNPGGIIPVSPVAEQFLLKWRLSVEQRLPNIIDLFAELTGLTLHAAWHPTSGQGQTEDQAIRCPYAEKLAEKSALPARCRECLQGCWRSPGGNDNERRFIGKCGIANRCFELQSERRRPLTLLFQARIGNRNPLQIRLLRSRSWSALSTMAPATTTRAFNRAGSLLRVIAENLQSFLDAHFLAQELDAVRSQLRAPSCPCAVNTPSELPNQFRAPSGSAAANFSYSRSHQAVDAMLQYLYYNYQRPMSLKEVAAALGMNPNYLSTLFGQMTGTTFHHYLDVMRLTKAKELLRAPPAHIDGVAHAVGYVSPNHFRQVFKRYAGVCPTNWAASQ